MTARAAALVAILALPLAAQGHGFRHRATAAYYYYPAPAVAVPVAPAVIAEPPLAQPAPVSVPPCTTSPIPYAPTAPMPYATSGYAQPTPAPPSAVPSLPIRGTPGVTESRSFFAAASAIETPSDPATAQAGFLNLSGREVVLTVEGRPQLLPNGAGTRFTTGRQFAWRVDDRETQLERLPEGAPAVEIVIRR